MSKRKKILPLTIACMALSSCGNAAVSEPQPEFIHYQGKQATCIDYGVKESWVSISDNKIYLEKPSDKVIIDSKEMLSISNDDIRYIAPLGHKYSNYVYRVEATKTTDGLEAHYECNVCNEFFDKDFNPVKYEDLIIKSFDSRTSDIMNDLMDPTKSFTSSFKPIADNSNIMWKYNNGKIETKNYAGWRLTNEIYNDFELDIRVDGTGLINPYHDDGYITKALFFGADADILTRYPCGYLISFNDKMRSGDSDHWIQVYYLDGLQNTLNSNSKEGAKFICGIFTPVEGKKFKIRVSNGLLTISDSDGNPLHFDYLDRGHQMPYCVLDQYESGHLGILNWTVDGMTVQTSFTLTDFVGATCDKERFTYKAGIGNHNYLDDSKFVNVFILSGQSNMEGNSRAYDSATDTSKQYLKKYCESHIPGDDHDPLSHSYSELVTGYSNVKISQMSKFPGNLASHFYSNESDPFAGKFENEKVGYGVIKPTDNQAFMGPDLGFSEVISKEIKENDNPTYLIKFASGGTSFNGYEKTVWLPPSLTKYPGFLYRGLVEFVYRNLYSIIKSGYIPVVKGFLWMQGGSDSVDVATSTSYKTQLKAFFEDIRNEFKGYTLSNNGDDIAIIDALIYDGDSGSFSPTWAYHDNINGSKRYVSKELKNAYIVDTTLETGLELKLDTEGGDLYHYSAGSMLLLGNAMGRIAVENKLLEFNNK